MVITVFLVLRALLLSTLEPTRTANKQGKMIVERGFQMRSPLSASERLAHTSASGLRAWISIYHRIYCSRKCLEDIYVNLFIYVWMYLLCVLYICAHKDTLKALPSLQLRPTGHAAAGPQCAGPHGPPRLLRGEGVKDLRFRILGFRLRGLGFRV